MIAAWRPLAGRVALAGVGFLAMSVGGCEAPGAPREPSRGIILISIDTLRADHLGLYGYDRDTSPFLDSLAPKAVVFDHAYVQLPGTLPSHMSIFTGLYPAEHGVYPPDRVLSQAIPTLPEVLRQHGFRTGGFTEGGYVAGDYGFARGFDEFDDRIAELPTDAEVTFARGADFLRRLAPDDSFFLFLHTYAVHDPYEPPEPHASAFWAGEPPETFPPTGSEFMRFNREGGEVTAAAVDYYRALYDGGIRYVDSLLRGFFSELESLGLGQDLTIVITSDHGEEFLEHGRFVHEQLYVETLRVPLLVIASGAESRRVADVVQSVDLAPTLFELAGLSSPPPVSGRSLAPLLRGDPPAEPALPAYGEGFVDRVQTVVAAVDGDTFQLLRFTPINPPHGWWFADRANLEVQSPVLTFEALSFHQPRTLSVIQDGVTLAVVELTPEHLTAAAVEVEPGKNGKRSVVLEGDGCIVPAEIGVSSDPRCLSYLLKSAPLDSTELYRLTDDPGQTRDVSGLLPQVSRKMLQALRSFRFETRAEADSRELPPELERRLRALGYLQ